MRNNCHGVSRQPSSPSHAYAPNIRALPVCKKRVELLSYIIIRVSVSACFDIRCSWLDPDALLEYPTVAAVRRNIYPVFPQHIPSVPAWILLRLSSSKRADDHFTGLKFFVIADAEGIRGRCGWWWKPAEVLRLLFPRAEWSSCTRDSRASLITLLENIFSRQ